MAATLNSTTATTEDTTCSADSSPIKVLGVRKAAFTDSSPTSITLPAVKLAAIQVVEEEEPKSPPHVLLRRQTTGFTTENVKKTVKRASVFVAAAAKELASTGSLEEDEFGGRATMFSFMILWLMLIVLLIFMFAFTYSSAWLTCALVTCSIIVSGLTRLRRGKKRDVLPSVLIRVIGPLWVLAALMRIFSSIGQMSHAAGFISDFACNFFFSILSLALLCYLLWMQARFLCAADDDGKVASRDGKVGKARLAETKCVEGMVCFSASSTDCKAKMGECSVRCGCWSLFFLFGLPSALIAFLSVYHSGKTLAYVASVEPTSVVCGSDGVCLSYSCSGEVKHGSIALVVNGFAATSDTYFFIGEGLSNFTRTCLYDPRGQGWSTWPDTRQWMGEETEFGFTADASDVLAILDYEFAQRGVAPSERVAVLPAHSRGQLVAIKFKATYQQHFKKVVVIGLDGVEECEAIQESFEDDLVETTGVEFPTGFVRYVLAPTMPFIGGIIDLAVDWAPTAGRDAFFAGNPIDQFPPEIVQLLPIVPRRAIINKYTMERFWEASAVVRDQWQNNYDGPTREQCLNVTGEPGAYLYIRAANTCLEEVDGVCCEREAARSPPPPSPVPPPPRAPCDDDLSFIDANNYPCSGWVGYNCLTAATDYPNEYNQTDQDALVRNCRTACGLCNPPSSPPAPPGAQPSAPTRRLQTNAAAGRYCAEHNSLVQVGSFAGLAMSQAIEFLEATMSTW